MSRERIDVEQLQELVRLHRMGVGAREVARLLGISPNTERQYRRMLLLNALLEGDPQDLPELEVLRAAVSASLPSATPAQQRSSAEDWHDQIAEALERNVSPKALWDKLRLREGDSLRVSLRAFQRYYQRLQQERGPSEADVVIPVETRPGEIAQVDFGSVGRLYDPLAGLFRRAWVFVMVLAYSRHMFAQIAFDQRVETWLRLHAKAFQWFGGCVGTLVPDNLRAAVVRAAFRLDDETELNRSYRELARHYGVVIDPTPPRAPEKKGKVESSVKYVKRNYFAPRGDYDSERLALELPLWLRSIAGERIHGTTRRTPLELFEIEKPHLRPLPPQAYELTIWKHATVHRDCHVIFDGAYYSAPWRLVGRKLWVHATASSVVLYCDDERVASHRRATRGVRVTNDEHLPELRGPYRHRQREYWQERADEIGSETSAFIRDVFESADELSRIRTVIAMMRLLQKHPVERAERACARARYFANYTYRGLAEIFRRGLDFDSLPGTNHATYGQLERPQYARRCTDFMISK